MMRRFALLLLVLVFLAPASYATLANGWHIPDNAPSAIGAVHMRNPEFEIGSSTTVTVFSGVQKFNNSFGTANQTGGILFYKGASQGSWQQMGLSYAANDGNDQYWKASFNTSAFGANEVIQYYLYLTFDSGAENTYIYAPTGLGDHGGNVTNSQGTAATSPYTIRNRPAFDFHANNRIVNGTTVQFSTKGGYVSKDGTTPWITNGAVYYTTNGSAPAGSLGVAGNGSTTAVPLSYDHQENDNSVAGNGMWWAGTVANLPTFTAINYKISLWNSSNNEEKFADYNAPTDNLNGRVFSFSLGTVGDPVLTVNGTSANYTTTHFFINEQNGDAPTLALVFEPGVGNVDPATVQIFTNLNRREKATQVFGGYEEGIQPPSGDLVGTDDAHYYKAYAMTQTSSGHYELTLPANRTGAYRLTARYKTTADPNTWIYYTSNGRRDHAVVVSPTKAREIVLYELNTLNANSTGTQQGQRGTFANLSDPNKRLNLDYVKSLGCNFMWFQPIHPNGIDGRQTDPDTNLPYEVGSPYAVKNFYEVMEFMSAGNSRSASMIEFQNFVSAADAKGVGVMLDAPFNHTSYDAELAQEGVNLISPGSQPTDQIRNKEGRFFSLSNSYYDRASGAGNIAVAPDRGDFGKFGDTYDVFYGSYSALVNHNPDDNGAYNNEGDQFFYGDPDWTSIDFSGQNVTKNVWKYFGDYLLYWINQTGGTPANLASNPDAGIDALRADFGQGLPPQCWEYIVNKTRTQKWNFVFMTESLDGGAVTYRSNRHFDILNENIVFPFKAASTTQDYRNIFDQRRSSYGQGLVLMNSTSHDEENYDDPYQALIRYTVSGAIDGVPMVFYGQENGVSRTFGFDRYELNFGKMIPHFKKFNSLQPILAPGNRTFGLDQLFPVFSGVGFARQFSPALRSSNRYYLNQIGGSIQPKIFSVAKYQTANGSPANTDVVFAFANLDRDNDQSGNYNVDITQNGSNLFGLKRGRTYDVKNVAAYLGQNPSRRDAFLNRKTGDQLLDNGFFVGMKKVPTADAGWASAPFEAQYLKVYDVTTPAGAPGLPTLARPNAYGYAIDNGGVTYSWTAVPPDAEGIQPIYKVTYQLNNNQPGYFFTTSTSNTFQVVPGNTLTVSVQAVNPNDIQNVSTPAGPSSGAAIFNVISASGDSDGDGMTNGNEDAAGTNPFDANSIFEVSAATKPDSSHIALTWKSVPGKSYYIEGSQTPGAGGYHLISGSQISASGASTSETISTGNDKFFHVVVVDSGMRLASHSVRR